MLTLSSGNKYYTEAEYLDLHARHTKASAHSVALAKDFNTVADRLREEATERDWCDDYNEWVDKVNDELTTLKLLNTKYTYQVEVKVTETRYAYITVEVEAASVDDAMEAVDNGYTDREIRQESDHADWERDDFEWETTSAELG